MHSQNNDTHPKVITTSRPALINIFTAAATLYRAHKEGTGGGAAGGRLDCVITWVTDKFIKMTSLREDGAVYREVAAFLSV